MPWNKDGTRKDSAFYLRSGNATPFKQMGASPLKQDGPNIRKGYGKVNSNSWLTEYGKKLVQDTKSMKVQSGMPKNFNIKGDPSTTPGYSSTKAARTKLAKNRSMATSNLSKFKNLAKVSSRALLGTSLLAGELLYSFGKESIKRKKAGKSGFNIQKGKANKPFTF